MIEIDREQEKLRKELENTNGTLHSDLTKLIRDRFSYSYSHMNNRYSAWRKNERQHLAYVDPDEVDKEGEKIFTQAKDIVVPYSYAILQTRLTYFFFAILGKNPIVPMEGRGPNDVVPAQLMSIIQDYQFTEARAAAVLYCFLQDAERYGVGIVRNVWHALEEERWSITRKPVTLLGYQLFERMVKERNRVITYEGNMPTNISPYNFFPDPRCNISDVKRMEFCGHQVVRSFNYLKMAEANLEYFNIDQIPILSKNNQNKTFEPDKNLNDSDLSRIVNMENQDTLMGDPSTNATNDAATIKLKELEVRLIPKDHGLSNKSYPEEYIITLANDQTIIKCEPLIYCEKSYYVGECNHDYASPVNLSTVDLNNGLSDHLSWLFNSHAANVRKIINDSVIVDPSRIELADFLKKTPVKIIRLKEDSWGVPGAAKDAIHQLQIMDVTRGHIQDSQVVMNLIQRVSAATDNIMGMVEEVRRTATETSSTINLATARLKLTAFLYYTLAIRPMYKAQVFNTQGFLSEERYYRITDETVQSLGGDVEVVKNRILVKPDQLYGNFDFNIPSFEMPIDKGSMAKIWRQIMMDIAGNQMLSSRFDLIPVFRQMIYNMGIMNTKDFEIKTKVMPDEQVTQMAKEGSLAPINDVANVQHQQMMDKMQMAMGMNGGGGANGAG